MAKIRAQLVGLKVSLIVLFILVHDWEVKGNNKNLVENSLSLSTLSYLRRAHPSLVVRGVNLSFKGGNLIVG